MNQQFNEGKFNYSDLLNMPNVSMIDLGSFQNPVQQPKKEKKKKNYLIPVIGALIAVVACVAYIVMKFASQQQQLEDKWSEYDDCGWM